MRGKILLIEDDIEFSNLTRMWLKNAGYDVFTAQDGVEGMRRVYSNRPNLVLLDANVPKMDGWEVCRRIRDMSDDDNGESADNGFKGAVPSIYCSIIKTVTPLGYWWWCGACRA